MKILKALSLLVFLSSNCLADQLHIDDFHCDLQGHGRNGELILTKRIKPNAANFNWSNGYEEIQVSAKSGKTRDRQFGLTSYINRTESELVSPAYNNVLTQRFWLKDGSVISLTCTTFKYLEELGTEVE